MWKVVDFQDLPEGLEDKKQAVEVKENTVSFQSQGQDFRIYYQTASPVSNEKGLTVLLLHGMRFSSQSWTDLGTLHVLAALGYSAVAIDLPGYAKSKDQKPLDDTACFLSYVIAALKLDRPVLVSPSMSGSYTLPFLLGAQPEKAEEKSRGYVPVAPIYTDQFEEEVYKKCQVPTLIVQGSKDIPMGSTASQHLAALPNSYLHIMEGGGHPCYLDNPKEWHYLLYNFLEALTK